MVRRAGKVCSGSGGAEGIHKECLAPSHPIVGLGKGRDCPRDLACPGSLSTHPHMSPDHHGQDGFGFYCFQRTEAPGWDHKRSP